MPMIQLQGLGLAFPHKTCFADFHAAIEWGQRIAIVGDNGAGKSSLLRMLRGELQPSEGRIVGAGEINIGYVAQVLDDADTLSGGERLNRAMSTALSSSPDLLLLDEPTNHLDSDNRRALMRMLRSYYGAVVMVTHDEALMDEVCDEIWHIEQCSISVFAGRYADFLAEQKLKRASLQKQLAAVKQAKQDAHAALMQEQERAAHARERGVKAIQERRWATIKSATKLGRGSTTGVQKQAEIRAQQRDLTEQLAQMRPAEVITPRFHFPHVAKGRQTILQVSGGAVGYDRWLVQGIHLSLAQGGRLALSGRNGSGKSTVVRAILGETLPMQSGEWLAPPRREIGYLDQHYGNLVASHTVLQALACAAIDWAMADLRRHLSDFLFRHDEAVQSPVTALSGGERARLSLACIAAKPPQLLVLDEPTNNLDRRTRQHLIEILRDYPGAMLVISHDAAFLAAIGVAEAYALASMTRPCS